jgi:opacity protein-like surface antigen
MPGLALRLAPVALFVSCAQTGAPDAHAPWRRYLPPPAVSARNHVQGMVGLTEFDDGEGTILSPGVEVRDSGISTFPMLGGAWQHALRDGRLQLGVEGGFTFGWDSDRTTIVTGGGAVVTERDNDVFLLDGFVGLYANLPMRGDWRIYGGAGPVLQYGSVQFEFLDQFNQVQEFEEDGLGGGWYARTGVEIDFGNGILVGIGVRWVDTYVDLGRGVPDLDLQGIQTGLTVSQSY